jgi:hypothetical protein
MLDCRCIMLIVISDVDCGRAWDTEGVASYMSGLIAMAALE